MSFYCYVFFSWIQRHKSTCHQTLNNTTQKNYNSINKFHARADERLEHKIINRLCSAHDWEVLADSFSLVPFALEFLHKIFRFHEFSFRIVLFFSLHCDPTFLHSFKAYIYCFDGIAWASWIFIYSPFCFYKQLYSMKNFFHFFYVSLSDTSW